MRRPGYLNDYKGFGQLVHSRFRGSLNQLDDLIFSYQRHIANNKVHDPEKMAKDEQILAKLLAKRENWFIRRGQ